MAKTSVSKYYEGIGRRKTSTARVRVFEGESTSSVNLKPVEEYFALKTLVGKTMRPFVVTDQIGKLYFTAKVTGGGINGQADAVKLGVARALVKMDPLLKTVLRKEDLLIRDPRMVERKKYHHIKARKKPQFSKR